MVACPGEDITHDSAANDVDGQRAIGKSVVTGKLGGKMCDYEAGRGARNRAQRKTNNIFDRNCLACFGPVEPLNFAVFQAFSRIRKNRRPGNRAVSQRGTPDVADFMEHETLNKYFRSR